MVKSRLSVDPLKKIADPSPVRPLRMTASRSRVRSSTKDKVRRNVLPSSEIVHRTELYIVDEINTWPHHEVYYRRWIHKEITTLRQAVCQYGESTREGWEAIQKLMNTECRLEGQRKSWCINVRTGAQRCFPRMPTIVKYHVTQVLRYRWAVEACSLTSEVTNERMLLRRLLFKYGVETSDKHTLWGVFHQRLESRYPGSIPVPEGRNPGEFLEEVWKKVEQPKILQTRLFPWLEHEEQLFV